MINMATKPKDIKDWEKIEIERSSSEAAHTNVADLRADKHQVARYLNPPADTCYPLEYAYHLLGEVQGRSVVDFGCGSGENSLLLAQRKAKVYAMDISESLIRVAQQRLELNGITSGVEFFVASGYDIALADESVDVVFGMAILHHLELPPVAREVRRVLRKGGRAIFEEPIRNSSVISYVRDLIPYQAPDVSPFERPLTNKELKDFANGFSHYRSRAFRLPYVALAQILPFARNMVHPLYRFDGTVLKKFPFLNHYATMRVFELTK